MDHLYRLFLKTRTGAEWLQEKARIKAWIAGAAEH
jgi:hypothetical protein